MALVESFSDQILTRPTARAVVAEMFVFIAPVSIAFFIGILVGWAWKPRWASFGNCIFDWSAPSSPSPVKNRMIGSSQNPQQQSLQDGTNVGFGSDAMDRKMDNESFKLPSIDNPNCSSSVVKKEENHLLTDEDLKHLWHLVEKRDGGPPWKHMMDRSTPAMSYQAWQRDPETGPPQYCSRTVYEDATAELLRDFFWDDDFRLKWDDMLLHATTLDEFPTIGESVVHWIRRVCQVSFIFLMTSLYHSHLYSYFLYMSTQFPFFCSDREYIIGRRIWGLDGSFYCVTKGVPCPSIPRKQKPRRVDVYYSSWFIQPARSKKGNNQPACEVTFFHHEDMGIPWEIAKFGVRQGMWGAARKVEQGFRRYQKERACSNTMSPHVAMAELSTKIDQTYLTRLESNEDEEVGQTEMVVQQEKQGGMKVPKLLIICGAVILACSLDQGLLTKAVIFGVARRFGNIGRRAFPPTTQL